MKFKNLTMKIFGKIIGGCIVSGSIIVIVVQLAIVSYINDNATTCFNGQEELQNDSLLCREFLMFRILFTIFMASVTILELVILPIARTFSNHSYTKESSLIMPIWIVYIVYAAITIINFGFINDKYPLILTEGNYDLYTNISGINDTFVSKLKPPEAIQPLDLNGCQMINPNLLYNNETLKNIRNKPNIVKLPSWLTNELKNSNSIATERELQSINTNIFASKTIFF